ncbi:MAG: hypothetical protein IKT29_01170 [Flavobacteriales bacterium]|nr:hypothetical protein [Flavobacteriales bacterium]
MLNIKKQQTFDSIIADTFDYISQVWRHFVPTMLRVNIIYILAACVMVYMIYSHKLYYYDMIDDIESLSTFSITAMGNVWNDIPFARMSVFKIVIVSILGVVLLVTGVVFILFTPVYMILNDKYSRVPTYDEIISYMSERFGRIVAFCLWSMVLYVPVVIVSIIMAIPLCIIIVGIPVVFVYFVLLQMLFNMSLYAYMHDDDVDYFKAVNIAWGRISDGFWRNVGAFIVIGIVSSIAVEILKLLVNAAGNINNAISAYDAVVAVFIYSAVYLLVTLVCDVVVGVIYFSGDNSKNDGYFHS